jgi:superfamily II DNA or RNA helicase
MIQGAQLKWLIDNGYLSKYRFFGADKLMLDFSKVSINKKSGEFDKDELDDLMSKTSIVGDCVQAYVDKAENLKAVVFCRSIKNSMEVVEKFKENGINAAHIDGNMDINELMLVIKKFAENEYKVLSNVDLIGEGTDLGSLCGDAELTIDCMIDLAPTNSLVKAMQKWGRVLRQRKDKKYAVIIDQVGNFCRHGLPCFDRDWTLDGNVKIKKKNENEEEEKNISTCTTCFLVFERKQGMTHCPHCGTELTKEARKELKKEAGEIVEVDIEATKQLKNDKMAQGKARDLESLLKLGKNAKAAQHILDAREEKKNLVIEAKQLIEAWQMSNKNKSLYEEFGILRSAVNESMKPKELKNIIKSLTQQHN